MKSVAALVVMACAAPAVMAQFMVNSLTDVVQCQPTQLTWSGGSGPFYLSIIPAGQPAADPIKQFGQQNGNSYTWDVDLPVGTAFTIELKDSTGAVVYSGEQTVMSGSDTSCTNSSTSASASISATSGSGVSSMASTATSSGFTTQGAGAFAAPTSASASGSSSGSTSAAPSGSANVSASHSSGSATPSATHGTQNAAERSYAALGVVTLTGFLGLLGFALL